MKKFLLPALFAALSLATVQANPGAKAPKAAKTATKAAVTYKLQPNLSTLGWEGKAVTHGHNGTVQFASGDLQVNGANVVGGTVTVEMKTIKATDITDAETQAKFYGHMAADDFFLVEKFPTATFKITSVTPIKGAKAGENNATVAGDMTIKGVTNKISFPAKVGVKDGVAAASGTVTVDRTKYGLKYGSKSFFESIGDKAINDDFTLSFNVIAKK
ncbi:YceI family protein [Hymenobacter sp. ASUV-10]|uniref:YceI family protein n=1 Tax=Hymenobacter aranciens TaxID=3063996 RepID=A0ABT9BDG3_9BACT|nr:YceI family protein [Hymenobacter sp. ASUV-10]MDO7876290.1 YceI family protein [Hymenobacter sp. ASUV-10]